MPSPSISSSGPFASPAIPRASSEQTPEQRAALLPLRRLLWLFLALWVTEGALRKWILPGLANPLLVVRDPVLLLIYLLAYLRGVFPKNLLILWIVGMGVIALVVSILATDVPFVVELYGFRASYLHLPLIFLFPTIFNRDDLRRIGFWTLVCSLPMAVLVVLQFSSRPTSWLNAGAGGAANSMLESAYGHIRPSGTFSFTNGLGGFSVLVAAFFLWQLFEQKLFPRLLWLASGAALVIMIALSGSRSAVGSTGLIIVTVLLIGFVQPRYWSSSIKLVMLLALGGLLIGSFSVFSQGLQVFSSRFGSADNVQTGFFGRFFEAFYKPFSVIEIAKPWGAGLGLGTNAANGIINDGKRGFLLAEGDTARVILESGPLIGVTYQLMRTVLVLYFGAAAFRSLYQRANTLPMLIFSGAAAVVLLGEFAQPTELGLAVIAAGLCLAANQSGAEAEDDTALSPADAGSLADVPGSAASAAREATRTVRGRSAYAERLHGTAAAPRNE